MASSIQRSSNATGASKSSSRSTLRTRQFLEDLVYLEEASLPRFRKRWPQADQTTYTYTKRSGWQQPKLVYSDQKLLTLRDELRFLWGHLVKQIDGVDYPVHQLSWTRRIKWIQDASENIRTAEIPRVICQAWLARPALAIDWKHGRIVPDRNKLETVLACAAVEHRDRLRYCQNPECVEPYFYGARRDQQFCSKHCASYGQRESKLRWWKKNKHLLT